MRFPSLVVTIFVTLILVSCAGTTDKSEYLTFNEQMAKFNKTQKNKKLISDLEKIPKFNSLRGKMAPGFLFYLSHPSDEKLKGRFRADFTGILRLPYNVRINVKGKSFKQLKEKVLTSYSKYFQKGVGNVDFRLLYRQYYVEVRGFVKKSGRYLVTRTEGIDKVIDKAGGLRGDLKKNFYKAEMKQQNQAYAISLNQYFQNNSYSNAFTWTGGDNIFITEQDASEMGDDIPIVTVLSGVVAPGKILYKPNANLYYYISKSGGAVAALNYTEAFVFRNTSKGLKKIKFDMTEMDAIPNIEPNDIIMLQADKRTSQDRAFERTSQVSNILLTALLLLAL